MSTSRSSSSSSRPVEIWSGPCDTSDLDGPEVLLQLWGAAPKRKKEGPAAKKRKTSASAELAKPDVFEGSSLRAIACVDTSHIPLWMASGRPLRVYTSDSKTEEFFKKIFLTATIADSGVLSRAIIVKLEPPLPTVTGLVILGRIGSEMQATTQDRFSGNAAEPATDDQVLISAFLLNTSHQLMQTSPRQAISDQPTFLMPSAEDMQDTLLSHKRSQKLERLLERRAPSAKK
ncbi:hypothetical protein BZA70DRAFT_270436 [Myxozyma melibiosi]|uniref:Telomere replication protein EST3 n=1 Tax=Myxozyma melibiosi TaxID=54550 RepID=A0ABR1FBE9_9ASCO